jgi:hypothetical protein
MGRRTFGRGHQVAGSRALPRKEGLVGPVAQKDYAQAGQVPERLSVCHLLGDPAMEAG